MRRRSSNKVGHGSSEKWNPGRFLLDVDAEGDPLDPEAIFPERGGLPLEIEIGTGKGTFILGRAEQRPEINFLGIEYAYPYAAYTADRIRRAGLENARMICADASAIVQNRIGDESVLRLHIYFPDPWPKRKHHRRRLIQPETCSFRRPLQ